MQTIKSTLIHTIVPVQRDLNPTKAGSPAIILLHGRGAHEEDLLGLQPYLDPNALLVVVRAPLSFPYGGYTWYETLHIGTPEPAQFAESYERLVQFLEDVRKHYPVDPNRIILLGFSMGAVMAYACALTKPEMIHSVVAHSGYIFEDTALAFRWKDLKGTGFFIAHGTEDPIIGVEFARRARMLLSETDAELVYKEYLIPHSMSEESVSDLSQWIRKRVDIERM
ncbi:MAG: alpha/beta fold hydrolase [Ignavibacteriales bacterium]|nr:alpha/beta fold hydrolase [Ignavibacteriales bacterium]